jgi:hypothetical protein
MNHTTRKDSTMSTLMRRARALGVTTGVALLSALLAPAAALAEEGATVSLKPEAGKLPGSSAIHDLTDGAAGILMILALLAVVTGAGRWALGSHSSNPEHAAAGRKAFLMGLGAAVAIGAAAALVNFFYGVGGKIK